jgi:hypothetical protein
MAAEGGTHRAASASESAVRRITQPPEVLEIIARYRATS